MNIDLETFIEKVSIKDPRDPATATAISLLLDFLHNLVIRRWNGILDISVDYPKMQESKTGPLWNALKDNGWCPSEAAAIFERFSVSGVYYMTQIRPPNASSHQQGGKCQHYKCNLRQLNDAKYQTKHVSHCSKNCGIVSADPESLASILVDKNTIPLIRTSKRLWNDNQSAPEILLEAWDGSKPFVTISHVWADGLGNPNANALPRCQMQRLTDMVQSLTNRDDVPFWLDTICVPPDTALKSMDPAISGRQRKAQDQAMVKMRQTYEESLHVLVLDSWIMSDASKAMGDMEKLMRIFSSGWNTRLWTYQEGALAKRISFILADGMFDMDEAISRIQNCQDWSNNYTLRGPLMVQYDSLRGFRSQGSDKAERIKYLTNALAFRATSVASDETLCLSALMGFDVQDILDVKDPDPNMPTKLAEARMIKFWSMFDRVPAAMFKFDGSTLPADGYGWACSSLLLSEDRPLEAYRSFLSSTKQPAYRTDRGLDITLAGLEFRSTVPLGLEFYVEDDEGQLYHFYFSLSRFKDKSQKYTHNHSGNRRDEICINPSDVSGNDTLAFIFDPVNELQSDIPVRGSHIMETGILVVVSQNQADGKLDARKLGYAVRKTLNAPQHNDAEILHKHIQSSSQNIQDYDDHSLRYPAKNNGTLLCAKGKKVGPQTWRIV
ncbi:het domain protein [Phlyctema vagabunda]|uniref:Het domain protein n=1 Tax=Phlyctema vagabunda TaxID=108571 RepID=A0ABR4PQZ8_9HELO